MGYRCQTSLLKVLSLAQKKKLKEGLETLSLLRGYRISLKSVKCKRHDEPWIFGDDGFDQPYAIIVVCGWGLEQNYKPWVIVHGTEVRFTPKLKRAYSYSSNNVTWPWGDSNSYWLMDPDRSLILVQGMEHDNADLAPMVKTLWKALEPRLKTLLMANANPDPIANKMIEQMQTLIWGTRCIGSMPDGLFDTLKDSEAAQSKIPTFWLVEPCESVNDIEQNRDANPHVLSKKSR